MRLCHRIAVIGASAIWLRVSIPRSAVAEQRPLFELGFGPGAIYQNYYAGVSDTREIAFPAIIPVYRGKALKTDEEGARVQLFQGDR